MVANGWSDWVRTWLPLGLATASLLISVATAARSVGRDRRTYAEHVFLMIDSWEFNWEVDDDGTSRVLPNSHLRYELQNDSPLPVEDAVVALWPWDWRRATGPVDSGRFWPIEPHSKTKDGELDISRMEVQPTPFVLPPLEVTFTVAGRRWRRTPDAQLHWWAGWPARRWVRCWPHVNAAQVVRWEERRRSRTSGMRS